VIPSVLALPHVASAASISVLWSNGIRTVMQQLVPEFERASGHRVAIRTESRPS
jgi:hypothetical protein